MGYYFWATSSTMPYEMGLLPLCTTAVLTGILVKFGNWGEWYFDMG